MTREDMEREGEFQMCELLHSVESLHTNNMAERELKPWYLASISTFLVLILVECKMTYAPIDGACVGFAANRSRATRRMHLITPAVKRHSSSRLEQVGGARLGKECHIMIPNDNNNLDIGDLITP